MWFLSGANARLETPTCRSSMPQLYINTDKAVDRLFIEISAGEGARSRGQSGPMEKV